MYKFENRDAKSRTIVIISVAAVALLVALGIYSIVRMLHKPASAEESVQSSGLIYDASAVEGGWETLSQEEIEASLNAKVQEGMINISMNTAPVFPDGQSEGNLMIVNELINNYPQQVQNRPQRYGRSDLHLRGHPRGQQDRKGQAPGGTGGRNLRMHCLFSQSQRCQ